MPYYNVFDKVAEETIATFGDEDIAEDYIDTVCKIYGYKYSSFKIEEES